MPLNIETQIYSETKCDYCGGRTTKTCKSIHKRSYWCKTYQIITRPSFDEWLITQYYDTRLSEYKPLFKQLLETKQRH